MATDHVQQLGERCGSLHPESKYLRCALQAGHETFHQNGPRLAWADDGTHADLGAQHGLPVCPDLAGCSYNGEPAKCRWCSGTEERFPVSQDEADVMEAEDARDAEEHERDDRLGRS